MPTHDAKLVYMPTRYTFCVIVLLKFYVDSFSFSLLQIDATFPSNQGSSSVIHLLMFFTLN